MRAKLFYPLLSAVTVFVACEKVIDIPLDEAAQRFVVEAVIKDSIGANSVTISKTGSVYETSDFEKVSGAVVTITDASGTVYPLTEMTGQPGVYSNPSFITVINNNYTLNVSVGDQNFSSTCQTFYKPQLDSLTWIEQLGSFGFGDDTTYLVFFNFSDNADQDNFYRINAWINGKKEGVYYITNDELFNGGTYTQPLFASTVEKGDTVQVELISMDKANYTYFYSLSNASTDGGGPFSPSPGNPVTNISGGALGYFGAYTTDTLSIIIPL